MTFILELGYTVEHIQFDDYLAHHPKMRRKLISAIKMIN
jgi:hypothetical protein